jgi:carbon-monoxide dehydrogenase large subunit
MPPSRSRSTRAAAGGDHPAKAQAGRGQSTTFTSNTIYQWHPATRRRPRPLRGEARPRSISQQPSGAECDELRAAIGEYDAGTAKTRNTTQNPHVARLVIAAFVGALSTSCGYRSRRRRRLGSKIFIYPEEVVCWAARRSTAR